MKAGDLVRHKDPKFLEHTGIHLVTFVRSSVFKFLGHSGFHPSCEWEVINEDR